MTCREIAPLLSARASGPLSPDEEALVAAHLEACGACRAESARQDDLLRLLRVPAASAEEERAAAFLPARVLAGARGAKPAPRPLAWAAAGAALGLAVALGITAGIRAARLPAGEVVAAAGPATWQEPDPDELWEWSGELVVDSEESP